MKRIIKHYDDERNIDNGIIVTLRKGFSFEPNYHEGVRSFDTHTEAKGGTKLCNVFPCACDICKGGRP